MGLYCLLTGKKTLAFFLTKTILKNNAGIFQPVGKLKRLRIARKVSF